MRILLFNNEFPPIGGGGSAVCQYTGEYLASFGHEVRLITSGYKNLPRRETVNGIDVLRIPAIRRSSDFSSWWELLTYVFSALWVGFREIRRFRPDVIQAYFAVPAGGVAWFLTRLFRSIPYVVYLGGSDVPGANPSRFRFLYPLITPIIRWIFGSAAAVTACAENIAALARRVRPDAKILLVPNGVDTRRFHPRPDQRPNDPLVILGVGRLIKRKGFQFVIEALPAVLRKAERRFRFRLIGSGEFRKHLEQRVRQHHLESIVDFAGLADYRTLDGEYQNADVFVMPSLSEGMPLALLEAMACGVPVVATDVSGNNELVKNGQNGFRYAIDPSGSTCDIKALADHLAYLINHESERRAMGNASVEAAAPYDWKHIAETYDRLYKEMTHPA